VAAARVERRLAAILAADVVGYSALMEQDEDRTLARLKALRKELVEPLIAESQGRVVKLMGDGVLVEFASIVDAVRCAVLIQQGTAEREAAVPADERIRFRIGINLGDVVREADGDLYGDGVNVAARLEQLAEPGGVVVSGTAYDHLQGKLDLPLEFVGEQRIKNIERLVRAYRVRLDGTAIRFSLRRARRVGRRVVAAALALFLLVAAAAGGWWWRQAGEPAGPPLPDEPSIVVLPFANLTGEQGQDYFVDGITDGLTTDLSRIDGSFVIASHTAFTYQGRAGIDVRTVGRELGVRYVLEGGVRRAGAWVGVDARLIDAATGAQLWAERVEGSGGELPALYDEVTGRIAATLRLELIEAEGRRVERERRPNSGAADDAMRGWALLLRINSRENRAEARRLFERALAREPDNVSALAGLAHVLEGWSDSPTEDRQRALGLLRRALDLEPNRADAYFVLGLVHRSQGQLEEAAEALRAAIALDRNYARAHLQLGLTANLLGRPEEAIAHAQRAIRLNPRDPNLADHQFGIGVAHQLLGHVDAAIGHLERARAANPRLWYIHWHLAAAYGSAQRLDEAKRALAEHRRLRPEFRSIAAIRAAMPQVNHPAYQALCERTVHVGLRRAGFPDS
jgi:class 3 adenylate cyclase/TolB-like protein/tetratricopeptide (TPR) repeat protein